MTLPVVASSIWYVPSGLLWACVATLCFWIWRRSKSTGHLVMLVGAGWLALHYLLATFDWSLFGATHYDLQSLFGSALIAVGFYLSVKPIVAEDIGKVRRFVASKLGKPGLKPTIPYAPPSASSSAPAPAAPTAPPPAPYSPPSPPPHASPSPRPSPSEDLNLR